MKFLSTSLSVKAQTAIISLHDVRLVPNVLLFMGLVVFFFGLLYTLFALYTIKERKEFKRPGIFEITTYTFFYLLVYPVILIVSAIKLMFGKAKW